MLHPFEIVESLAHFLARGGIRSQRNRRGLADYLRCNGSHTALDDTSRLGIPRPLTTLLLEPLCVSLRDDNHLLSTLSALEDDGDLSALVDLGHCESRMRMEMGGWYSWSVCVCVSRERFPPPPPSSEAEPPRMGRQAGSPPRSRASRAPSLPSSSPSRPHEGRWTILRMGTWRGARAAGTRAGRSKIFARSCRVT